MSTKFKAGDRVEVWHNQGTKFYGNATLTKLYERRSDRWYYKLDHSGNETTNDYDHCFKLIEDKGGVFIVVNRTTSGHLTSSAQPSIHTSQEDAETEALWLANTTSTSSEFLVFKAVSKATPPEKPKATISPL